MPINFNWCSPQVVLKYIRSKVFQSSNVLPKRLVLVHPPNGHFQFNFSHVPEERVNRVNYPLRLRTDIQIGIQATQPGVQRNSCHGWEQIITSVLKQNTVSPNQLTFQGPFVYFRQEVFGQFPFIVQHHLHPKIISP